MCGYFCIGFIDFMFPGRSLINFTGLFSPYDFKKNDEVIFDYLTFQYTTFLIKNNSLFAYLVFLGQQDFYFYSQYSIYSNFEMHHWREQV